MRRGRLQLFALVALISGTGAVVPAAQAAIATGVVSQLPPTLLRDVEAGRSGLIPLAADRCKDTAGSTPASSCQQADTTIEPSIAVNPSNPLNVVAVYQENRRDDGGDGDNGYATTFDGGVTWTYGNLPGLTRAVSPTAKFRRASDAVVAFGPNNTVYADSLVFDGVADPDESGVAVNVSHDGGLTWGPPTFPDDDNIQGLNDKNWVVVDNSNAPGHHYGRVYTVWDKELALVMVSYSDDQGQTWSPDQPVYAGEGIGAIPLVLPSGGLAVVFDSITLGGPFYTVPYPAPPLSTDPNDVEKEGTNIDSDRLVMAVAPTAGLTAAGPLQFLPPTAVASYEGSAILNQRAGGLPAAAIDPSSGRIYVAWESGRFRQDSTNDIVVRYSDSLGATWGPVIRVNPGPLDDSVDHYNAMIDVGSDGVVRVGYRQVDESLGEVLAVDTYFQQSTDGGDTWSAPLKVNTVESDPNWGAYSRGGLFQGDYNQLVAAGSWTYLVRCESYQPVLDDPNNPPVSHRYHQTTWVSVVGPEGSTAP